MVAGSRSYCFASLADIFGEVEVYTTTE